MIPYFCFEKIQIGPLTVYLWGTFVALGFLTGLFLLWKMTEKESAERKIIVDSFSRLLLAAIIGGRLAYVLQFSDYYFSRPLEILKIWQGGMAFHGGLLAMLLVGLIYARLRKITLKQFLKISDLIALAAPLAIAVGRIGCSLINDHQGRETSLLWGIVWPDGTVRHPIAEYLIIANLIIFFLLWFLRKRLKQPGQLFLAFLFLYSLSRFLLDFLRTNDPRYFLGLSTAQWLSLAVLSVIIGITVYRKRSSLAKIKLKN